MRPTKGFFIEYRFHSTLRPGEGPQSVKQYRSNFPKLNHSNYLAKSHLWKSSVPKGYDKTNATFATEPSCSGLLALELLQERSKS